MAGAAATVVLVAVALPTPASASSRHGRSLTVQGSVTAADDSSITVQVTKANKAGQAWADAHGGTATITVTGATKVRGPHRLARSATDLRPGDAVQATAKESADETELDGRNVQLKLLNLEGTLASWDGTTAGVNWTDANKPAQAWLDAHGDPNPVSVTATADSKIEGTPAAGDAVEVQARPSAANPAALEIVTLEAGSESD